MRTKILFTVYALALGSSSAGIAADKLGYDVVRCFQPENGETHFINTYLNGEVTLMGGGMTRHIETIAQTCKDDHGDKEAAHGHAKLTKMNGGVSYAVVTIERPKRHKSMPEYEVIITDFPDNQHSDVKRHSLYCKHD